MLDRIKCFERWEGIDPDKHKKVLDLCWKFYNEVNKDFHLYHVDGKMPYLGDKNRHASVGPSIPGYEVYIEKGYKAYQVVDPARVWMMLPINPRTRNTFGTFMTDSI
jgi:hypothetical protein